MSPLSASLPVLALLAAAPLAAQVPTHADPAMIDRAVAGFIAADPAAAGAAALPLDPRLRLAPCRAALRLSWYGARQDSVRVECPDAPNQQGAGWRVFVRVPGAPVGVAAAAAAPLVLRGEAVSIGVTGQGFTVSRSGEALEPGSLGQWIRVRTAPAAPPLRARVSGPGTVELNP